MAFVEDMAAFFNDAEFGLEMLVDGVPVIGIFDRPYFDPVSMASTQPTATVPTDLAPVTPDLSTVVVMGVLYVVRNVQPDGTGMTTLVLEKVTV
ncbi:hypothetical protein GCM10007242_45440 [Pigmentiphaga litoralis]|uniref:head-tail joining protein n=1 Tax=Pigmentiphaga litoralis TaxID=516702 RepID=UPI00167A6A03|nr:hypothetical protein [Pigmentiphaga litoralis]GGX33224.1 hypothetical protein GCM10007242_45440 [Pigmentiphaga litoralis]